jgi:hypothetical protein
VPPDFLTLDFFLVDGKMGDVVTRVESSTWPVTELACASAASVPSILGNIDFLGDFALDNFPFVGVLADPGALLVDAALTVGVAGGIVVLGVVGWLRWTGVVGALDAYCAAPAGTAEMGISFGSFPSSFDFLSIPLRFLIVSVFVLVLFSFTAW